MTNESKQKDTYLVKVERLNHGGKMYVKNDEIKLTKGQAARLAAHGFIKE